MAKEKLYFASQNCESCYSLEYFINEANYNQVQTIKLFEAIEDDIWMNQHFCKYNGVPVDNCECKKKECSDYTSKSGRGKCLHRGKLYYPANEPVFFNVKSNSFENIGR